MRFTMPIKVKKCLWSRYDNVILNLILFKKSLICSLFSMEIMKIGKKKGEKEIAEPENEGRSQREVSYIFWQVVWI